MSKIGLYIKQTIKLKHPLHVVDKTTQNANFEWKSILL